MKGQQMLNALPSLQKLGGLQLPVKKAHKIYKISKVFLEIRDFLIAEEQKLVQKYNVNIVAGGSLQFTSEEVQLRFFKEHAELMEYEIDFEDTIDLAYEELGDAKFMPKDFAALEGIVNFID